MEYLFLSRVVAGSDSNPYLWLRTTSRLAPVWEQGYPIELGLPAYLLVAGFAAIYAYVNAGYLVSVLCGLSLPIGNALVTIYGHGSDAYIGLAPMTVLEHVFPVGLLVATLGFLLGLLLRRTTHTDSKTTTHRASPPP